MLGVAPREEADRAAGGVPQHREGGIVVGQLRQLVASVGETTPPDRGGTPSVRGGTRAPRHHVDLVGDHEGGQQSDAELPQELLAAPAQFDVALRGAADRGEQVARVLPGETDAGVADLQTAARQGTQIDPLRRPVAERAARRDGVDAVLHQLAQVNARAGVQVTGEQVDHTAQVDLKGVTAHEASPSASSIPRCSASASKNRRPVNRPDAMN